MGHDRTLEADTALSGAFAVAERVAILLDRYAGDSGDDPEMIGRWTDRLLQLEDDIIIALGYPRTPLPSGAFAPRSYAAIIAENGHE